MLDIVLIQVWAPLSIFLGFFWCVKESCIPSLIAKKYKYLLCFYQVAFERSHPHLSQTFVYRSVPPQHLTNAPYNLFRKLLFSQFHTEPLFRTGISKILSRENFLGLFGHLVMSPSIDSLSISTTIYDAFPIRVKSFLHFFCNKL